MPHVTFVDRPKTEKGAHPNPGDSFAALGGLDSMDDVRTDLIFCPVNSLWSFGEAIAESMLCGDLSIDSVLSFFPRMRRHSPPGSGCERIFSIF